MEEKDLKLLESFTKCLFIIFLRTLYYSSIFVLGLSLFSSSPAQDISSDFWQSRYLSIFHDHGIGWEMNSAFKPFRWEDIEINNWKYEPVSPFQWMIDDLNKPEVQRIIKPPEDLNKLQSIVWLGTLVQHSAGSGSIFTGNEATLYSYFHFRYNEKFVAHLYPRVTTNPNSSPHYTGRPRDIRRAGFNSGETDLSGLGYNGDWVKVWFGRGRQNWGALYKDNLALSDRSAAYDHLLLQLQFRSIKLRYFHGYLETRPDNYHRYVTGRGIEYSNLRNLVVSASEIIIYSGENRPMDIAYFNPISTQLEVELNYRVNRPGGTSGGNAVWQLSLDWMPVNGFRLSGNFLADEFILDEFEREEGKSNALALQGRIAYSRIFSAAAVTLYIDYTRVGTYTFRHGDGNNNFVSRELPLGTEIGSDGDKWDIGLKAIFPFRIVTDVKVGFQRSGERNILNNTYDPYDQFTRVPFPSGVVEKTRFFEWEVVYRPKRNIELKLSYRFADSSDSNNQNYFLLTIDGYLPLSFGI